MVEVLSKMLRCLLGIRRQYMRGLGGEQNRGGMDIALVALGVSVVGVATGIVIGVIQIRQARSKASARTATGLLRRRSAQAAVAAVPVGRHLAKDALGIPPFRDIIIRQTQPTLIEDRPHPIPTEPPDLPAYALDDPRLSFIDGWYVRLTPGRVYRLDWDLATSKHWPETELVLFQRVEGDARGLTEHYRRIVSIGAVTTGAWSETIRPTAEGWLLSAWAKRHIAWDEPWLMLPPDGFENEDQGVLSVTFGRPLPRGRKEAQGSGPRLTLAAEVAAAPA